MLRKIIIILILISLFSFVLTSCSINRQSSGLENNVTISNSGINGNADNIIITQALKSKDSAAKTIAKIFQRLQKNDLNCLEGIVAKDIVWKYEGVEGAVPFAGTFYGKESVKKFWRTYLNSVTVINVTLRYFVHAGAVLDLHWTEEGISKPTGKKYIMETVQRWEFNDKGQVQKVRWYNDPFAMYHAFQPNTSQQFSLAQHPADYNITGDGPIEGLPIIKNLFADYLKGDLQAVLSYLDDNVVYILAGPQSFTPFAGTWLGSTKFIEAVTIFLTTCRYETIEFYNFVGDGCIVDVEFVDTVLVYSTGKIVPCSGLHSFILNSKGKIVKFRSYNHTYNMVQGYLND
ncbi:MAG: nuclear transport factor 2 family protein [Firmicutes bacterium]|nr:nuclear transport factor 2 family protein [Bacillota bacterium]